MRVLVCGDRNWTNSEIIRERLAKIVQTLELGDKLLLIHGAARGADSIAGSIAMAWAASGQFPKDSILVMPYPAQWGMFGKAAGVLRNQQMLEEGRPELVLAFHNNIELSRGTRDMVTRARKANVRTEVISE